MLNFVGGCSRKSLKSSHRAPKMQWLIGAYIAPMPQLHDSRAPLSWTKKRTPPFQNAGYALVIKLFLSNLLKIHKLRDNVIDFGNLFHIFGPETDNNFDLRLVRAYLILNLSFGLVTWTCFSLLISKYNCKFLGRLLWYAWCIINILLYLTISANLRICIFWNRLLVG